MTGILFFVLIAMYGCFGVLYVHGILPPGRFGDNFVGPWGT